MYSLIVTAKLNDVDPQAWLAEVLARIAYGLKERFILMLRSNLIPFSINLPKLTAASGFVCC